MIIWNRRPLPTKHAHPGHHDIICTSLCCAKSGESVCVTSLCGCEESAAKLRDLGVREGVQVTVVSGGDPLLVKVDGARFGIGRSAAVNVLCDLVEDPRAALVAPHQKPLQRNAAVS